MENREKLLKEIEILEDKCDQIIEEFDKEWFSDLNDKSFNEYESERKRRCGGYLTELTKLRRLEKMTRPVELGELPDYGDVMTLKDFKECCESGGFIDYDGYGYYVKDDKKTNIEIIPSDFKNDIIRKEFDTIIWFNR